MEYTTILNSRRYDTEENVVIPSLRFSLHYRTLRTVQQPARLRKRTELTLLKATAGRQPVRAKKRTLTKLGERIGLTLYEASTSPQPAGLNKRTVTKHVTAYPRPTGQYSRPTVTELQLLLGKVYRVRIDKEARNDTPSKELIFCYLYRTTVIYAYQYGLRINDEWKKHRAYNQLYVLQQTVSVHNKRTQNEEARTKKLNWRYKKINYQLIMVIPTRAVSAVIRTVRISTLQHTPKRFRLVKARRSKTGRLRESRRTIKTSMGSKAVSRRSMINDGNYTHNCYNVVISTRAVFAVIKTIKSREFPRSLTSSRPYRAKREKAQRCAKARRTRRNPNNNKVFNLHWLVPAGYYLPNYANVEISTRDIIAVNRLITQASLKVHILSEEITSMLVLWYRKRLLMLIRLEKGNVRLKQLWLYLIFRVPSERHDDAEGDKRAYRGDINMRLSTGNTEVRHTKPLSWYAPKQEISRLAVEKGGKNYTKLDIRTNKGDCDMKFCRY